MMVLIQSVSEEGPKRDQPVHEIKNTRYKYGYSHNRLITQTPAKSLGEAAPCQGLGFVVVTSTVDA